MRLLCCARRDQNGKEQISLALRSHQNRVRGLVVIIVLLLQLPVAPFTPVIKLCYADFYSPFRFSLTITIKYLCGKSVLGSILYT